MRPTAPSAAAFSDRKSLRTVGWSQLEPWQQDNPGITTGYRRLTHSWKGCLESLYWWHNETVNVWSHLLGALAILAIYTLFYLIPQHGSHLLEVHTPVEPFNHTSQSNVKTSDVILFRVFLLGAFVCFACSALFHSSLCHSEKIAKALNRVDYFGILVLGTVNYFPTFHYAFFCAPQLRSLYIALMSISGSAGIYLSCSPTYGTPAYRRMRTYTFFACGMVAIVPLVHAVCRNGWKETSASTSFGWLLLEVVFYVGGAILYSERWPEYIWPGRFDLIGSSHQIFHICSLLAVLSHYAAISDGFRYWHSERGGICL
ncbi:hemolysin-III related-domain-containing protein [Mycena capillaripes]|nr:hemolysin-III related-domain-containing protein [Mycena capillaripes]